MPAWIGAWPARRRRCVSWLFRFFLGFCWLVVDPPDEPQTKKARLGSPGGAKAGLLPHVCAQFDRFSSSQLRYRIGWYCWRPGKLVVKAAPHPRTGESGIGLLVCRKNGYGRALPHEPCRTENRTPAPDQFKRYGASAVFRKQPLGPAVNWLRQHRRCPVTWRGDATEGTEIKKPALPNLPEGGSPAGPCFCQWPHHFGTLGVRTQVAGLTRRRS